MLLTDTSILEAIIVSSANIDLCERLFECFAALFFARERMEQRVSFSWLRTWRRLHLRNFRSY